MTNLRTKAELRHKGMDLSSAQKVVESQVAQRKQYIADWNAHVGAPAQEISLSLGDEHSVTYGIWKRTADNPNFAGEQGDYVMLIPKGKNGYSPYDAQYFPARLVEAMQSALKENK